MLISWVMGMSNLIVSAIFQVLNVLPDMPTQIVEPVNWFFSFLMQGFNLACCFVDISMVKALIPIVIAILNFDHLYHATMWALRKIPFLSIR